MLVQIISKQIMYTPGTYHLLPISNLSTKEAPKKEKEKEKIEEKYKTCLVSIGTGLPSSGWGGKSFILRFFLVILVPGFSENCMIPLPFASTSPRYYRKKKKTKRISSCDL
jgi:hypothetical protein